MPSRTSILPWLLATAGFVFTWPQGQDPKPAATPAAIPGKPPAHQLEGVYELRKRIASGQSDVQSSRGYLAITNRHMFLCLVGPGDDPDEPLLRSGVRTWKPEDEFMRCELKLGYFTDSKGDIHVERPGLVELRRVELAGGRLRIFQDSSSYLEFERIE